VGEYLRCSGMEWGPLWTYCSTVAPEIAGKVEHGYTSDGDGLGGSDAEALAARLRECLESGHTAQWEVMLASRIGGEAFDVGLVREFVRFLEACGGFAIF